MDKISFYISLLLGFSRSMPVFQHFFYTNQPLHEMRARHGTPIRKRGCASHVQKATRWFGLGLDWPNRQSGYPGHKPDALLGVV